MTMTVPVNKILVSPDPRSRAITICSYRRSTGRSVRAAERFYLVNDGVHRLLAARRASRAKIEAVVL